MLYTITISRTNNEYIWDLFQWGLSSTGPCPTHYSLIQQNQETKHTIYSNNILNWLPQPNVIATTQLFFIVARLWKKVKVPKS
jgi:hypothetical protein